MADSDPSLQTNSSSSMSMDLPEKLTHAAAEGEEGGDSGAIRSGSRMLPFKQQLKTSKGRIMHSFSNSRKSKAQPRRARESDDDEAYDGTGPSTAFFSPPSFQLTQIIHDSQCFVPRQGHCCVAGGGDVLIFGGQNAEGQLLDDFIRYIPGINAFEPMKVSSLLLVVITLWEENRALDVLWYSSFWHERERSIQRERGKPGLVVSLFGSLSSC